MQTSMADKKQTPLTPMALVKLRAAQNHLSKVVADLDSFVSEEDVLTPLKTFDEVLTQIGGPTALAELAGVKTQTVAIWQKRKYFATNTYLLMMERLAVEGFTAPASLWGMKE